MSNNDLIRTNRDRSIVELRLEAATRLLFLNTIARFNSSILITEYPKSGGTWLSELVSDITRTPFPQNRFPAISSAIYHGHYIKQFSPMPTVILWRDPRDITISWYYHCLLSEHTNQLFVQKCRKDLRFNDFHNVEANLPKFLQYMFTEQSSPKFTWNDFFDFWSLPRTNTHHTSYENLSANAGQELMKLCTFFGIKKTDRQISDTVDRHSFESKAGRKPGRADAGSFMRKGVVGDSKNYFTEEATAILNEITGGRMNKYAGLNNNLTAINKNSK